MASEAPLTVLIWSDFVCPFCNVARERAGFLRREAGARIEWLPFDLHPEYPPQGIARAELARRYGASFADAVRRMNEEAGLVYNPHPERVPNTRRALELGEWARARGAYDDVHERIMNAYWTEGQDITGWDVLAPLVARPASTPARPAPRSTPARSPRRSTGQPGWPRSTASRPSPRSCSTGGC